jgi:uncharacterized protein (TIGR03435 family)
LFPVSRRGGNIPVETMSEPDHRLIAEFNARRSEEAFAALVRQHVNLVFATALRQVGDAGAAEEITQNVFVALAQAAGKLGSHPTIAGWLHQTALNKSREWLRSELRRRRREQVAVNLELARAEGDSVWASLVPLLDEALLELREPDRLAVILHFMEGRTFQEVGSALGIGEDTARKRVNRCLGQLTHFFHRRGFAAPALAAGAPLFTLSSHAAPAGLAASATTAGLAAAHSAASTSTLTLIKGALKLMAWTKAKTAIVSGVVVLLAAGTTTVTVKRIEAHKAEASWRVPFPDPERAPSLVEILPTKFPASVDILNGGRRGDNWIGVGRSVFTIVQIAYNWRPGRILFADPEPKERYDFISTLRQDSGVALQAELKRKLGFVGHREMRDMDVLVLKVRRSNAPGLKPPTNGHTDHSRKDYYYCDNQPLSSDSGGSSGYTITFTSFLEDYFGTPVIDQTGLTQHFHIDFKWNERFGEDPNHDALKQALLDQLGLELVPSNMPIEMLVVERAKN